MYNTFLKKLINKDDFNKLLNSNFCKSSFAQYGEDLAVNKILSKIKDGTFLDLGSYHPIHFSNTFLLYLRGWRGINVDGNYEMIEMSKKVRPFDKNIHAFLSNKKENCYYIKNKKHPAMNRVVNTLTSLTQDEEHDIVNTITLNEIIKKYRNYMRDLCYLNIDLEFKDEILLKEFDFTKYHPLLITIEIHEFEFYEKNNISEFLKKFNYSLYSYIKPTAFYIDIDFKNNKFSRGF